MAGWGAAVDAIFQLGNSALNAHSQHKANRTNLTIWREQQKWMENMANTAVQRRANDIKWAGGNPALAFVNGQEASTPTVSTPEMRAAHSDVRTNFTAAALAKAQIDNIKAQTYNTTADTRVKTVEARNAEKFGELLGEANVSEKMSKAQLAQLDVSLRDEQGAITTEILKNQQVSSAAEARRLKETVESVIQQARQQARTGQLDLEALENVAKVGGLEAGRAKDFVKMIIDLIRRK